MKGRCQELAWEMPVVLVRQDFARSPSNLGSGLYTGLQDCLISVSVLQGLIMACSLPDHVLAHPKDAPEVFMGTGSSCLHFTLRCSANSNKTGAYTKKMTKQIG